MKKNKKRIEKLKTGLQQILEEMRIVFQKKVDMVLRSG